VPVFRLTPAAERIPAGWLDLDHLSPEIGEDPGAKWCRDVMAQLDHLQPGQRTRTLQRHAFLLHTGIPGDGFLCLRLILSVFLTVCQELPDTFLITEPVFLPVSCFLPEVTSTKT